MGHRRTVRTMLFLAIFLVIGLAAKSYLAEDLEPQRYDVRVVNYALSSKLLDRDLGQIGVLPPGESEGRPLLLFLHGRDATPLDVLSNELFAALAAAGEDAPAVALVNGGTDSYFHDRDDGPWGSYVIEEALPEAIEQLDADPERVAIGGISMGGFGALDLVRLNPGRFCAVGAHSAALFADPSEVVQGAFDDDEDFESHDLLELIPDRKKAFEIPIWLDVGNEDPFLETNRSLESVLQTAGIQAELRENEGGHEDSYWESNMEDYIAFYSRALQRCPGAAR